MISDSPGRVPDGNPAGIPDEFWQTLRQRLAPGSLFRRDELMSRHTTMRIGGAADAYWEPTSEPELAEVLRVCRQFQVPVHVIGRGSNLLVRDGGIRGLVIRLSDRSFSRITIEGEGLYCGGGALLKAVAIAAKNHGLGGLEFLEGIPGSIGGAMRMNAGAMGSAIFEVVASVRIMDLEGQVSEVRGEAVTFSYRHCSLLANHIGLAASLRGEVRPREAIARTMRAYRERRWATQPTAPSAGCMLKNPREISAGKLIEELELKGMRIGGIKISEVHGNFMVNDRQGTAQDVLDLIELIRHRAREKRGVELEPEIQWLGETGYRCSHH